jgi:hypothetical protein
MPRVLVVTADIPAAAAVCAALHGEYVTVCYEAEVAVREMASASPYDVVFCEPSLGAIELLVRLSRQTPPPRVALLATAGSHQWLSRVLQGDELSLVSPADYDGIQGFVRGR